MTAELRCVRRCNVIGWSRHRLSAVTSVLNRLEIPVVSNRPLVVSLANRKEQARKEDGSAPRS